MECPRRWTVTAIIIYLSFQTTTVFCQHVAPERDPANSMVRDSRDCLRGGAGNPGSSELYNSILSMAASNGMIPDLLPMFQGQPIIDTYQRLPFPPDGLAKPLSVVPIPTPGCPQEPIIFSSQPLRPQVPNQNVIMATPLPCGSPCPPNAVAAFPQPVSPLGPPPTNGIPQFAQTAPLDNYICAQNAPRQVPLVLQPQCQFGEVCPYNPYNQIVEPLVLPEVNTQFLNFPILPPPQALPAINPCAGVVEITPNLIASNRPQTVFPCDCQPLNLQINVPTPTVPAPKITVVSASPQNPPVAAPPCCPELPANYPPFQYPPQLPIVLGGGSTSSLRNLLPIILVALFNDRGSNNGGGCCCCCNCGNSGNNIPIPYPIPIPVNNPIINTCSYSRSSRSRESRDDEDEDDEDRKRK